MSPPFIVPPAFRPEECRRAIEVALESLKTDRVRTRSAVVALAVAMAVVTCLTTLVERGRAATIRSLEKAGLKNLYLIDPLGQKRVTPLDRPLTWADPETICRLAGCRGFLAIRAAQSRAETASAAFPVSVYSISGSMPQTFRLRARSGRLLSPLDVERKSPYAVIGVEIARLIGLTNPLGAVVTVGHRNYEIVGLLDSSTVESATTGEIPSIHWNRALVVPLGTEPAPIHAPDERYPIDVGVLTFSTVAEAEAAASLPARMDPSRFGTRGALRVGSPMQSLRQYRHARRTFDRLVWLVGFLTAMSAVIGISNHLSASVIARAKEIGLRRAVGARSADIVLQFQAEGLLLGIAGGGLGLLAGALISSFTRDAAATRAVLPLSFASFSALAGAAVLIGILTGIRPSVRAARIDPAAALREG